MTMPGARLGEAARRRQVRFRVSRLRRSNVRPFGLSEAAGPVMLGDESSSAGLVAEVAASSVSIDRNAKLRAYQRNSVQEYLLWRVENQAIDWFVLRGRQYDPLPVGPDGIVRSEVFPGLWLDAEAMARGDMGSVMRVLQQGIDSPEHAQFVQRLKR